MKKTLVFHPFLIAIYVILFHFSVNLVENLSPQRELPLPILCSLIAVTIFWFALSPIIKDKEKRGLIISTFWLTFFSYGHIVTLINNNIDHIPIITNSSFAALIIMILTFIAATFLILKKINDIEPWTKFVNIMSVILIIFAVIAIFRMVIIEQGFVSSYLKTAGGKKIKSDMAPDSLKPDIYYIIPDTYASTEIIRDYYHYDNTPFINYLKSKGFHIVENGKSNYHRTHLSLTSSLGMRYLKPQNEIDEIAFFNKIIFKENRLFKFMKEHGYIVITISSGGPAISLDGFNENSYVSGDVPLSYNWSELTEFQWMLVCMTPAQMLVHKKDKLFTPMEVYHRRIVRAFNEIGDTGSINKPVFVFAHILAPHSPLISKNNGVQFSREYYVEQLKFTNDKIKLLVDKLTTNPKKPTIIIIQGDHGPSPKGADIPVYQEQYHILNAIYLPDNSEKLFADNHTPVNTFRVLLNRYFGTKFELLENHHYFSTQEHLMQFINVDNEIK